MDDQRGKKTEDRFYDRPAVRSGRSLLLALFLIASTPDLHFHLINVDSSQALSRVLILYQSRAEFPNSLLVVFVDVFLYLFKY